MARKFTYPKLKVNNGTIIIYYHHVTTAKIPTGVKISNKKNRGKMVEWDEKIGLIPTEVFNAIELNNDLKEKLNLATRILEKHVENECILTGDELKIEFLKALTKPSISDNTNQVIPLFEEFIEIKKNYFAVHGSESSIKDYNSLKFAFKGYEEVHNCTLCIHDINQEFIEKFHMWLASDVKKEVKRLNLSTKVEGLMKPATFKKRLDSLYSFLKHLKSKSIYNYDFDFITEYKRRNLRKLPSNKETLTVEEVYSFLNFDFGHDKHDRIRYAFVFACLTGMRYGDLKNFDKKFLKKTQDGYVYKRLAQKTQRSSGLSIEVPLCKAAEDILFKYDLNLKGLIYPNNQTANSMLKKALKETNMFEDYTENKEKKTGRYLQRWECISMHKGRDTFITNLIDVTPLNELMKYTGHSKLSTLQIYLDRKREVKHDFVKAVFDKYISKEK